MAVKDWSTTAADNDDADAGINWLEGQSPATVNDSARAMMAAIASWYALIDAGTVSGGSVGGTADAITLTCSPTVGALAAGQRYLFKYTSTGNTGAVTLNVDSLGATAVRYKDVALVSGDIATSDWVFVVYDGTRFQMLNPPRLSWATTDIPTDTTGGAVADLFLFADASQSNALNKVTIQDMFNNVMTGLTADTAPDVADSLLTYDASGTAAKTTTITNFYKTINALTADATPDGAADYVATYDASASGGKKVLIQNLAATQAQQEAGTAITNFVTPGRQHFHPSAAKAWCTFDGSTAGTNAPTAGYNVTSVTRNAAGNYTINFTTAFSAATYAVSGWCQSVTAATGGIVTADPGDTKSTTALQIRARRSDTSGAIDSTVITVVCFGDFA